MSPVFKRVTGRQIVHSHLLPQRRRVSPARGFPLALQPRACVMWRWGDKFTGVIPSLHFRVRWKFSGSEVFKTSVCEGGKGVSPFP